MEFGYVRFFLTKMSWSKSRDHFQSWWDFRLDTPRQLHQLLNSCHQSKIRRKPSLPLVAAPAAQSTIFCFSSSRRHLVAQDQSSVLQEQISASKQSSEGKSNFCSHQDHKCWGPVELARPDVSSGAGVTHPALTALSQALPSLYCILACPQRQL